MEHLQKSSFVEFSSDFLDELCSSEELIVIKGGNIPPPRGNGNCGCGTTNGNCGCGTSGNGNCGC